MAKRRTGSQDRRAGRQGLVRHRYRRPPPRQYCGGGAHPGLPGLRIHRIHRVSSAFWKPNPFVSS